MLAYGLPVHLWPKPLKGVCRVILLVNLFLTPGEDVVMEDKEMSGKPSQSKGRPRKGVRCDVASTGRFGGQNRKAWQEFLCIFLLGVPPKSLPSMMWYKLSKANFETLPSPCPIPLAGCECHKDCAGPPLYEADPS